jgi:hypothetical protein
MATEESKAPKVLKFLNNYRKEIGKFKIKAFYANHLCKKNCLENKLSFDNDACLQNCDSWLEGYFKVKKDKNPD